MKKEISETVATWVTTADDTIVYYEKTMVNQEKESMICEIEMDLRVNYVWGRY